MKLAYRVPEVMHQFGIGRQKLYDLLNAGKLEKMKSGRITMITGASIERWMNECIAEAECEPSNRVGQKSRRLAK